MLYLHQVFQAVQMCVNFSQIRASDWDVLNNFLIFFEPDHQLLELILKHNHLHVLYIQMILRIIEKRQADTMMFYPTESLAKI